MKGFLLLIGGLFAVGYLTKRTAANDPNTAIRANICGARGGCYDKTGTCWIQLFDGSWQGEQIALPGEILPTSKVVLITAGAANPCAPHAQFK